MPALCTSHRRTKTLQCADLENYTLQQREVFAGACFDLAPGIAESEPPEQRFD
jgi:hypothetical protein